MNTRCFKTLLFALLVAWGCNVMAQDIVVINLDATTNGGSMALPDQGIRIYDDGGGNTYGSGYDYHYTISCVNCADSTHLSFYFEEFDINPMDTLFVYDGPTTSSPLLIKANNDYNDLRFKSVYVSPSNTSYNLTLRLKASSSGGGMGYFNGFSIRVECAKPCALPVPHIDSVFYKTHRDGVIYDTCTLVDLYEFDTTFVVGTTDSIDHLDTNIIRGVNLCLGDGVVFRGYGEYLDISSWYSPEDANTEFQWHFGNGTDSLYGVNLTEVTYEDYVDLDCYNVVLELKDEYGCASSAYERVKVRLAPNPIKTIMTLPTICTDEATTINVGYDGGTGSLQLRRLSFTKISSKTNDVKTFIPDGPRAAAVCGRCYTAPVTFDEFPGGRLVQDKGDICSICVNYEHTYMGDYSLAIICPTGNKAYLKYKDVPSGSSLPSAAGGGGSRFTGCPYGGNDFLNWDASGSAADYCDSLKNMYGVGWNYCFSRNQDYTLVDGQFANTTLAGNYYLASAGNINPITFTFDPIPSGRPGNNAGTKTFQTVDSSNHEDKSGYYMPADDFSTLVGCPLNGTWEIEICDELGRDNGWVFSWSMDICGISSGEGCEYQVPIDSVVWMPDPTQSDWDLGYYRGIVFKAIDSVTTEVSSPDTAGYFRVTVDIYDSFGCEWDTATHVTVEWTPAPNLGDDTTLCGVDMMTLNARDRHAATSQYTYLWEPTGETSDSVFTRQFVENGQLYVAEVTNHGKAGKICQARDSIYINTGAQPIPSFDPGIYPLEGCEPFTINIKNSTVSGDKHHWIFGDGYESTEDSPSHTYAAGTYDLKYYVSSDKGCKDSLIFPELFTVFPSPTAAFSWEPVYPTVLHPSIQLENRTNPMIDENKYFWEIQYDKDNNISFHTLIDKDPTFDWRTDGEDISGSYLVRLIARTDNVAPSGNVVQCADTSEATILLVNDFLQFPNVVTANGDGINDKFVIKNLVEGLAYPINSLYIYNRWGACVYHKENISTEEDFWDPAADNLPAGTYYYKFKAKGYIGNIERNGVIELLR